MARLAPLAGDGYALRDDPFRRSATVAQPDAVGQERQLKAAKPARGFVRVTRHPLMWAIALWAAAHILARGDLRALVFFGGLLLLALIGTVLIDRRRAAHGEEWERFAAVTSNVPFVAIAQGRNRFALGEIGYRSIVIALVLYVVLLLLHPYILVPGRTSAAVFSQGRTSSAM